jgi:hypothetical protein
VTLNLAEQLIRRLATDPAFRQHLAALEPAAKRAFLDANGFRGVSAEWLAAEAIAAFKDLTKGKDKVSEDDAMGAVTAATTAAAAVPQGAPPGASFPFTAAPQGAPLGASFPFTAVPHGAPLGASFPFTAVPQGAPLGASFPFTAVPQGAPLGASFPFTAAPQGASSPAGVAPANTAVASEPKENDDDQQS